jgi:hypothetical protein
MESSGQGPRTEPMNRTPDALTMDVTVCVHALEETLAGLVTQYSAFPVAIALGLSMNSTLRVARETGQCTEKQVAILMEEIALLQLDPGTLYAAVRRLDA